MQALASSKPQHEEFEPSVYIIADDDCDTILLFLPGFDKKLIKVQVATPRKLTVSGHGPVLEGNSRSFRKEFQIPESCDVRGITTIFNNGILYVRQPKVITVTPLAAEQEQHRRCVEADAYFGSKPELVQHQTTNLDNRNGKYKYYNQVLRGLAVEMKRRRNMFGFFVAVLASALLFTLCAATCQLRQK